MAPVGVRTGSYSREEPPPRYQPSPQSTYPPRRRASPSISNGARRKPPPSRDSPTYAAPLAARSSTLFSRDRSSNGEAGGYRASSYRRPDDRERPPERYELPQSNGYHPSAPNNNERRSWYAAGSAGYLPPVRNPARYVDPPLRSNSPPRRPRAVDERAPRRSGELDLGFRQDVEDRHRPPKRPREEGGSFTPPEPKRAANGDGSDSGVGDEEFEILDELHLLFRYCHQPNKLIQNARFTWLKKRIFDIRKEVERMQTEKREVPLITLDSTPERPSTTPDDPSVEQEAPEELGEEKTAEQEKEAAEEHGVDDDELVVIDTTETEPDEPTAEPAAVEPELVVEVFAEIPAILPCEPLNLSMIQPETLDYEDDLITLEEEARLLDDDDYDLKSPEEPQIAGI